MSKELVGLEISKKIKNNSVIGVGTGSTVDAAIKAISERVKNENLTISAVPTSIQTAIACSHAGLNVVSPVIDIDIDFGFDGADAVDSNKNAIKGKGAAMLEEKILAAKCKEYYLIIDDSKFCDDICKKCFVPVEIIPSALSLVTNQLKKLNITDLSLRSAAPGKHGPVITERGNLVLDVTFPNFKSGMELELKSIVGVVETGLFENYATEVIIASATEIRTIK
jgi:ribose 5-phosphate isomerase A